MLYFFKLVKPFISLQKCLTEEKLLSGEQQRMFLLWINMVIKLTQKLTGMRNMLNEEKIGYRVINFVNKEMLEVIWLSSRVV